MPKLNQRFEQEFYKAVDEMTRKHVEKDVRKIKKSLRSSKKLTPRRAKRLAKQAKFDTSITRKINDLSALVAPVINYTSQAKNVRSSDNKHVKRLMRQAVKLAGSDIANPHKYVKRCMYSLEHIESGKAVGGRAHYNFIEYLNTVDGERKKREEKAYFNVEKSYSQRFGKKMDRVMSAYRMSVDYGESHMDAILKATEHLNLEQADLNFIASWAHNDIEAWKKTNAEQNNLNYKYWRTQRDVRVRHSHAILDGDIIKRDEKFNVGGYEADLPGDESLPPEESFNCRCTIEWSFVPRGTREAQTKKPEETQPSAPVVPVRDYTARPITKSHTTTEAIDRLSKDFDGVDIDTRSLFELGNRDFAKSAIDAVTTVKDRYDVVKNYPLIIKRDLRSNAMAMHSTPMYATSRTLPTITFSVSDYKKSRSTKDIVTEHERMMKENWLVTVDKENILSATSMHELGHHVENVILFNEVFLKDKKHLDKAFGGDFDKWDKQYKQDIDAYLGDRIPAGHDRRLFRNSIQKRGREIANANYSYWYYKVRDTYMEEFGEGRGKREINAEIKSQVSEYGLSSDAEFFAETFTEWQLNTKNPSKLAQAFGKAIGGALDSVSNK